MTRIFSWRCYLTRFIWRVKKLCLLFCRRSAASKIPRENWWERLSKNSIWTAAEKEFDSNFQTVKSLVSLFFNFFDAIFMHFLIATIFTTFYQFLRTLRFRSFLRNLRYFLTIFEFLPNQTKNVAKMQPKKQSKLQQNANTFYSTNFRVRFVSLLEILVLHSSWKEFRSLACRWSGGDWRSFDYVIVKIFPSDWFSWRMLPFTIGIYASDHNCNWPRRDNIYLTTAGKVILSSR